MPDSIAARAARPRTHLGVPVGAAVALVLASLLAVASFAAAAPGGASFELSPTSASIEVSPGGTGRVEVAVSNPEEREVLLDVASDVVWAVDGSVSGGRGPAADAAASAASLRLAPGESTTVVLSVDVSPTAPVDGLWRVDLLVRERGGGVERAASVLVSAVPPPPAPANGGGPLDAALAAVAAEPAVGAAVALVGLAGAGVALARRDPYRYLPLAPLVPLFTRLGRAEVLEQKKRELLFRMIRERPGVGYGELRRDTGLGSGVLVHHLRTLERHRLVVSRREGPNRRFYPTGAAAPATVAEDALTPGQERVLEALGDGALTVRSLADRLGVTPQGASYHVKALERKGVLVADYVDGEWRYQSSSDPRSGRRGVGPVT